MRVLVVDDEAIIRQGISVLLGQGLKSITNISEASNGRMALELIETVKPDLMITDLHMPVMDGLELIEEIHRRQIKIVIVILTGYADFSYAQQALRFGVHDYLLKPVTQQNLDDVIMRTLMNDPYKWTEDLKMIRQMKQVTSELAKAIMSENKEEAQSLLKQWATICMERKFTLLELKRIMGYFYFSYQAEFLLGTEPFEDEALPLKSVATSSDQLFSEWETYFLEKIKRVGEQHTPRNKRLVQEVLDEIHNYYGEMDLNIQRLSAQVGLTAAHLSKMFREVRNMPLTRYISEYRLERVKEQLESDEETKIHEIAERCGFSDYPHFSKVFKRNYGLSPQEYRDKYMTSKHE